MNYLNDPSANLTGPASAWAPIYAFRTDQARDELGRFAAEFAAWGVSDATGAQNLHESSFQVTRNGVDEAHSISTLQHPNPQVGAQQARASLVSQFGDTRVSQVTPHYQHSYRVSVDQGNAKVHHFVFVGKDRPRSQGLDAREIEELKAIMAGDLPGHEFRGNQWTVGSDKTYSPKFKESHPFGESRGGWMDGRGHIIPLDSTGNNHPSKAFQILNPRLLIPVTETEKSIAMDTSVSKLKSDGWLRLNVTQGVIWVSDSKPMNDTQRKILTGIADAHGWGVTVGDLSGERVIIERPSKTDPNITAGDSPGHPFRGNQHVAGISEGKVAELYRDNLGYSRTEMPRIMNVDKSKFIAALEGQGIRVTRETIDASALKATQKDFDIATVKYLAGVAKAGDLKDNPIVISDDNRVLDGHHRWAVASLNGERMNVVRVHAPMHDLVERAHAWNKEIGIKPFDTLRGDLDKWKQKVAASHYDPDLDLVLAYDPTQPRDETGRWEGEGGATAPEPASQAFPATKAERKALWARTPLPGPIAEDHAANFDLSGNDHIVVPLDNLVPTKPPESQPTSVENAMKGIRLALDGRDSKRVPISVSKMDDGRYKIEDGNATFGAARRFRWSSLPVRIVKPLNAYMAGPALDWAIQCIRIKLDDLAEQPKNMIDDLLEKTRGQRRPDRGTFQFNFDEDQHPRDDKGRWAEKGAAQSQLGLEPEPDKPEVSREKLLVQHDHDLRTLADKLPDGTRAKVSGSGWTKKSIGNFTTWESDNGRDRELFIHKKIGIKGLRYLLDQEGIHHGDMFMFGKALPVKSYELSGPALAWCIQAGGAGSGSWEAPGHPRFAKGGLKSEQSDMFGYDKTGFALEQETTQDAGKLASDKAAKEAARAENEGKHGDLFADRPSNLPALAEGKQWGRDLHPKEIAVGDVVKQMPSKASSGFSGTVHKVGRVNIHVMSSYQMGAATPDNPPKPMDLGPQSRFGIDFVSRGNIVHRVSEKANIAASEPVHAAIFTQPTPFTQALASHAVKKILPTTLNTKQLQALGPQLFRKAFVSAQVAEARILDTAYTELAKITSGKGNVGEMRLAMNEVLRKIGYNPTPGTEGGILDLGSLQRQTVMINTNLATARGYGQALISNQPDMVAEYPAWELTRFESRIKPRGDPSYPETSDGGIGWEERWEQACEESGDSDALRVFEETARMIALKSSGVWQALGSLWDDSLGSPFPPFAWLSGMNVLDVDLDECVALGLIDRKETPEPMELPGIGDEEAPKDVTEFDNPFIDDILAEMLAGVMGSEFEQWRAICAYNTNHDEKGRFSESDASGSDEGVTAFHGTPHEVHRFSMDKIGTGEGAQVYGYGLYFAQVPAVAAEYARNLSSNFPKTSPYLSMNGWTVDTNDGSHRFNTKEEAESFSNIKGNIYTVKLKIKSDELLDWDKTIAEQSDPARRAILQATKQGDQDGHLATLARRDSKFVTGGRIYNAMEALMGKEKASQALSNAGIKGIRFLDQGSRPEAFPTFATKDEAALFKGTHPGNYQLETVPTNDGRYTIKDPKPQTSNYVIFDASRISITAKNGKPVTMHEAIHGAEQVIPAGVCVLVDIEIDGKVMRGAICSPRKAEPVKAHNPYHAPAGTPEGGQFTSGEDAAVANPPAEDLPRIAAEWRKGATMQSLASQYGLTPERLTQVLWRSKTNVFSRTVKHEIVQRDPAETRTPDPTGESRIVTKAEPVKPDEISVAIKVDPGTPGSGTMLDESLYPPVEFPVDQIKMSKEVPNFKDDADPETGVVEGRQLRGEKYLRLGKPAIVLWERSNGDVEIITGRHRLEFARRLGETTIPSQIVYESEEKAASRGQQPFDKHMALTYDAESNIQDNQGDVKDYAHYFRNTKDLTHAEAKETRGLLRDAKGEAGWAIGKDASDDLYTAYSNGRIPEGKAVAIAQGAPGNDSVQSAAMSFARSKSPEELKNFSRALTLMPKVVSPKPEQGDIFGFDDSAIKESERIANAATKHLQGLSETSRVLGNAINRGTSLELTEPRAVALGIADRRDLGQLRDARVRVKQDIERHERWMTDPELVRKFREQSVAASEMLTGPALSWFLIHAAEQMQLWDADKHPRDDKGKFAENGGVSGDAKSGDTGSHSATLSTTGPLARHTKENLPRLMRVAKMGPFDSNIEVAFGIDDDGNLVKVHDNPRLKLMKTYGEIPDDIQVGVPKSIDIYPLIQNGATKIMHLHPGERSSYATLSPSDISLFLADRKLRQLGCFTESGYVAIATKPEAFTYDKKAISATGVFTKRMNNHLNTLPADSPFKRYRAGETALKQEAQQQYSDAMFSHSREMFSKLGITYERGKL